MALHGLDLARLDVGGQHFARHHMVGKDRGQQRLVSQNGVEVGLGDLGKCRVVGGKDSERAGALERRDQVSGLNRCNQRLKVGVANGDVHDVFEGYRVTADRRVGLSRCIRARRGVGSAGDVGACSRIGACSSVRACQRVCGGVTASSGVAARERVGCGGDVRRGGLGRGFVTTGRQSKAKRQGRGKGEPPRYAATNSRGVHELHSLGLIGWAVAHGGWGRRIRSSVRALPGPYQMPENQNEMRKKTNVSKKPAPATPDRCGQPRCPDLHCADERAADWRGDPDCPTNRERPPGRHRGHRGSLRPVCRRS